MRLYYTAKEGGGEKNTLSRLVLRVHGDEDDVPSCGNLPFVVHSSIKTNPLLHPLSFGGYLFVRICTRTRAKGFSIHNIPETSLLLSLSLSLSPSNSKYVYAVQIHLR
jgi:hypothetical protein